MNVNNLSWNEHVERETQIVNAVFRIQKLANRIIEKITILDEAQEIECLNKHSMNDNDYLTAEDREDLYWQERMEQERGYY